MDFKLIPLFSIPLFKSSLTRNLTENELVFLENKTSFRINNIGNTTTIDNFILDNPEMVLLKKDITDLIDIYCREVLDPKYPIDLYVTQSWMNINEKGNFHHKHVHTNSLLSGILYINVNNLNNTIKFYDSNYVFLDIEPKKFNYYNHHSWTEQVDNYCVLIFPSYLAHEVPINESDQPRISISFNVFCKGIFGKKSDLNYLKIE